eukprot:snap_masked-scaffold_3-processed-gene-2.30-mRNA-1 protein AED:1.00 eAED:1.00 QI:0/-1/0/0/-1/1/1/0/80
MNQNRQIKREIMKENEMLSDVLSNAPAIKLIIPSSFADLIEMSCTSFFTSLIALPSMVQEIHPRRGFSTKLPPTGCPKNG